MPKPKVHPLSIWYAEGNYVSKGHHSHIDFCSRMRTQYGMEAGQVRHDHARWMPPGCEDDTWRRTFKFCNPGPGAFPVTYWEG